MVETRIVEPSLSQANNAVFSRKTVNIKLNLFAPKTSNSLIKKRSK